MCESTVPRPAKRGEVGEGFRCFVSTGSLRSSPGPAPESARRSRARSLRPAPTSPATATSTCPNDTAADDPQARAPRGRARAATCASRATADALVDATVARAGRDRHPRQQRRHDPARARRRLLRRRLGRGAGREPHAPCFACAAPPASGCSARGRGKIVNIASLLSFQGGITVPAYAASKGGVAQLTKALANEWAGKGVNVNAIAPGYIHTDNTRGAGGGSGAQPADPRAHPGRALGRAGRPGRRGRVPGVARQRLRQRPRAGRRRRLDGTMTDAAKLTVKAATDCRFDAVSLGEVMLRLDPGEGRVHTTRTFQAWEGGGEYNVSRGLRRCFGLRTAHRHRAGRQPGRPAGRGSDAPGRRRPVVPALEGIRRRRARRPQRAELHRARLRPARRRRLLGSRRTPRCRRWRPATSTGSSCSAARTGIALAPHGRRVLRAVRGDAGGRARRDGGRRTSTAPACRTTSTTAIRSGGRSAARCRRARSTAR